MSVHVPDLHPLLHYDVKFVELRRKRNRVVGIQEELALFLKSLFRCLYFFGVILLAPFLVSNIPLVPSLIVV